MKFRLAAIVLIISCALSKANAQTQKGSFMIGGSASLQRTDVDRNSPQTPEIYPQGSFSISPTVGYFFIKNLVTGVQLSYGRTWSLPISDLKSTSTSIGPVVRYYFPFGKFAVFPEVTATFAKMKTGGLSYDPVAGVSVTTFTNKFNTYRAGVGATWFVSPHVGIEGIFSYRQQNRKDDPAPTKQSAIGFNFGIQFYIPAKAN